jgi:NADPH2:quinone reductase
MDFAAGSIQRQKRLGNDMAKAVRVHQVGGPEVLTYEDVDVPAPGSGEVRIRQHAIGLNFIDTYFRTGLYKAPGLPFIAGNEAAGEVIAVGPGVTNFHPGDRVAYYYNLGGYATERNIPADKLVKLPDHISYEQGAVLMLKGLTVWYLLHKTFKVEPGHRVLIHAAAGGIGLLACQWAKALGANVIGTVGSEEKARLAAANGCDHVILYRTENFVERVKQISRGELCDVVYDGVGKDTFPGSLSCLRPRGLFVSFGNASGPVPPFPLAELNNHGSLYATRPKLNDYVGTRKELIEGADALFAAVISGTLHVPINHAYALKDAQKAHRDLESRATTGSGILKP